MADQGKDLITMTVPVSTARALFISGAGTLSATLKAVGILYDSTDSTQSKGQVQITGSALITLAETLTAGALVVSDAAGKAAAHVEDTDIADGNDHLVRAILLEGGDAEELVDCVLV